MSVSISRGNSKMGSIVSVSLPAGVTCAREAGCLSNCYAHKLERIRKSVREAYKRNLTILEDNPEQYWKEVERAVKLSRFFRFHVSGDIPDPGYFLHMVTVARNSPNTDILCFTKRYKIVNNYLGAGHKIPSNLHVILSGWPGYEMDNPFGLPEAHVIFKDGTTTAGKTAKPCGGNCAECAITDDGCWTLKPGEQVVFHQH